MLEDFLNPEILRPKLIVASIYITAFELLKSTIVERIRSFYTLAGCGKTRFEADAVPRNSLVSTAQPDKKKVCVEKTSSSWMCSAT